MLRICLAAASLGNTRLTKWTDGIANVNIRRCHDNVDRRQMLDEMIPVHADRARNSSTAAVLAMRADKILASLRRVSSSVIVRAFLTTAQ